MNSGDTDIETITCTCSKVMTGVPRRGGLHGVNASVEVYCAGLWVLGEEELNPMITYDLCLCPCSQTKVQSVRKRPDFSLSGQWDVVVEADEKQETLVFDGVLVCSGHHTDPYLPLHCFPGASLASVW